MAKKDNGGAQPHSEAPVQLPQWVEALLKDVYRQKDFAVYYRSRAIALNVAVHNVLSHDVMELRYRDAILKEERRITNLVNDLIEPLNKEEKDELRALLDKDVHTVIDILEERAITEEFKRRKVMYPSKKGTNK